MRKKAGTIVKAPTRPLEEQYENIFPRLLGAVTTMATKPGTVAARLAWVVHDVAVFSDDQLPPSMLPLYRAFCAIARSAKVPKGYQQHPDHLKSTAAYWLHPRRAALAAELLTQMFEGVAYGHGSSEADLIENERAVAVDSAQLLKRVAKGKNAMSEPSEHHVRLRQGNGQPSRPLRD